ncbi:hypothetical protein ACFX2G_032570 [Malus domestica]
MGNGYEGKAQQMATIRAGRWDEVAGLIQTNPRPRGSGCLCSQQAQKATTMGQMSKRRRPEACLKQLDYRPA